MPGLTKTQLVRAMAEKVGTNNKTAALFLETLVETAIKETKKNNVFVLPGMGRLKKVQRKARMGRNPQSGEPIKIPAKTPRSSTSPRPSRIPSPRRSSLQALS